MTTGRLLLIITAAFLLAGAGTGLGEPRLAGAGTEIGDGRIAFSTATRSIDVIRPDGGGQATLVAGTRFVDPAWSPDGRLIAVHDANESKVAVASTDGTGLVRLLAPGRGKGWSPDGSRIALIRRDGESKDVGARDIWIVDVATGAEQRIQTPGLYFHGIPKWSPDGNRLVFSAGIDPNDTSQTYDLYTMSPSGGALTNITNSTAIEVEPDWSPDGSQIAFSALDGAQYHVFVMDANGANRREVTQGAQHDTGASWSPDGSHIAFQRGAGIHVIDASGANERFLVTGNQPDWGPSPIVHGVEFTQGTQELQTIGALQASTGGSSARYGGAAFPGANGKIAFQRMHEFGELDSLDVYVMEPDGSDLIRLTTTPGEDSAPKWSPDGSQIAFVSNRDGAGGSGFRPRDIFVMNADGSGQTNLTNTPSLDEYFPGWTPDGSRIYFFRSGGGLATMNTDGSDQVGELAQIAPVGIGISPDGDRIATQGSGPGGFGLVTMNFDGTVVQQLAAGGQVWFPDWSPDGDRILYVEPPGSAFELRVISATGGQSQVLQEQVYSAGWSPDGEHIVYARVTFTGATWRVRGISIMDANGSNSVDLTNDLDQNPDWQPLNPPIVDSVEVTQGVQVLQTLSALQSDLAGDGMPPVPMVAGRPAAMRIYMSEVDATTVYEVEASGDVNGSRFVQLEPGCTPADRRVHEGVCRSVDFMFTPPTGDWDVTLKVRRQQDSQVLEEHTFNLTSAETVPLIVEPVTVCDDIVNPATGVWGCGSLFNFTQNLEFLRATFPGEVLVAGSGSTVYADTDEIPADGDWWDVVVGNVRALWTADGGFDNLHHFGVVRPEADAGTAGGIAYTLANAAAGKTSLMRDKIDGGLPEETGDELIAHLLGLNMGLMHAPSTAGCYGTPAEIDPSWPSGSPLIGEVGYNVAEEEPVADTHADWMGLCTPRWISPYTANNLIDAFQVGNPRLSGTGTVVGDFWLVAGTIDEEAGEAEFDPVFELETEGPTGQGDGLYTIEVRDGSDAVLATRFFKVDRTVREDAGDQPAQDPDIVRFAELVPVQANAAKIVVFAGSDEVGEIELGGATPVVTLTSGFSRAGAPPLPAFSWEIEDGDSAEHTYWVEFSNDGGDTWRTIAPRYAGTSLTIDNAITGGGDDLRIRVRASDGANTGVAVSEPFVMQLRPPTGAITSPTSGTSIPEGNLAWLQAMVVDPEDGFLDDDAIEWTSSRDGALGTGASLHVYDLSLGSHTISMLATDSDGFEVADSIGITVTSGGVFEGEPLALSGDVNCNGSVDSVDGLGVSRFVAGLSVSQMQPCPQLGTGEPFGHGDVNCSGEVDAIDALFILRHVAGLPVNLPGGCREIGT